MVRLRLFVKSLFVSFISAPLHAVKGNNTTLPATNSTTVDDAINSSMNGDESATIIAVQQSKFKDSAGKKIDGKSKRGKKVS